MNNSTLQNRVIGVDLGGTNVRVGLVDKGNIIDIASNLVPNTTDNSQLVLDLVVQTIKKVWDSNVDAIGIGVPGVVDKDNGVVYDIQNIPSWKEVHLKKYLENIFNIPVNVNNDANCFAVGERYFGKGVGINNFVGLTLGTGVGAGIISNGKLLEDANCGSGEFGMLPYLDSIYEDYCSGQFFKRKYNSNGVDVYNGAINGDRDALNIFEQFGSHLGNLIKTVMYSIDPEMIVLGGSVAKASAFFEKSMNMQIESFMYTTARNNIKIEFSDLKHSAVLGASALCY